MYVVVIPMILEFFYIMLCIIYYNIYIYVYCDGDNEIDILISSENFEGRPGFCFHNVLTS